MRRMQDRNEWQMSTRRGRLRSGRRALVAAIGVAALAPGLALATVPVSAAASSGSGPDGHVQSLNGTSGAGSPQLATSVATGPWTQVLDDEFNGTSIDTSVWKVYDNPDPAGKVHLARNVVVGDGFVSLKTRFDTALGMWSTAGMRAVAGLSRTYGKYEMSVRTSAGDSRVVALLWPDTSGVWPPEIDWMEMDGSKADQASRQSSTQTVHYGTSSQNFMIHTNHAADMTQLHTVGLEWGPGYVRYLLDGVVTDQVVTQVVSNQIMYLGLQTAPDTDVAPTVPVNMDIDWLKIYRYDGGSGVAPTVPLNVSATGGEGSATVTWDPPVSEGNIRLTGYTVTASSGQMNTVSYVSPNAPVASTSFTGLTSGSTYTFTVTATNPFGTSGPSIPSPPVTVTGNPPIITKAPTTALRKATVGATASTSELSTTVTYAASPGSSAICSYHLQRNLDNAGWTDVRLGSAAATVAKDTLPRTGIYQYQVQATGCNGLQSAWASGPAFNYRLLSEIDPSITYMGTWTPASCAACLGGTASSTSAQGATAVFTASDVQIMGIVATLGPNQGAAKVYVDGIYKTTIYTKSSTTKMRRMIYTVAWTTPGSHTVKLENLASSGHPKFDLDGVVDLTAAP